MNESKEQLLSSIKAYESLDEKEREEIKNRRLHELVDYARKNSPFFKEYYKDLPNNFSLSDIPLTSKKQLMPHFDDWVTDSEITTEKLDAYFSDLANIGQPFLDKYLVLTTSGTTGQALRMMRNAFHANAHGALMSVRFMDRMKISQWLDPSKYKMASIIGTGGFHSAVSSFERMKASSGYPQNFLLCSTVDPIPETVARLNEFNPDLITGYPSVLAVLAQEKLEGRLTINPKAIACSAEQLTDYAYGMMKEAFNCIIANSFCSTEGGEVAFNCSEGNLHLNEDWVIVEPVDEKMKAVKAGQMSNGVLITNLASSLQPVIRYFIDDSVMIESTLCPCGCKLPVLKVIGRNGTNLSFKSEAGERTLAPIMFDCIIANLEGVLQFQFVQKSDTLLLMRAVFDPEKDREKTKVEIVAAVNDLLKNNKLEQVEFKIVPEAPIVSKGGKIKTVLVEK